MGCPGGLSAPTPRACGCAGGSQCVAGGSPATRGATPCRGTGTGRCACTSGIPPSRARGLWVGRPARCSHGDGRTPSISEGAPLAPPSLKLFLAEGQRGAKKSWSFFPLANKNTTISCLVGVKFGGPNATQAPLQQTCLNGFRVVAAQRRRSGTLEIAIFRYCMDPRR